jgi:hypothetical protein
MKLSSFIVGALTGSALTLIAIAPVLCGVVWRPVSGTNVSSEMTPDPAFLYVGANTITRKGDVINFDIDLEGEYVRYSANCSTGMMTRIIRGSVVNGQIVEATRVREDYFPANEFQQLALNNACSQNSPPASARPQQQSVSSLASPAMASWADQNPQSVKTPITGPDGKGGLGGSYGHKVFDGTLNDLRTYLNRHRLSVKVKFYGGPEFPLEPQIGHGGKP